MDFTLKKRHQEFFDQSDFHTKNSRRASISKHASPLCQYPPNLYDFCICVLASNVAVTPIKHACLKNGWFHCPGCVLYSMMSYSPIWACVSRCEVVASYARSTPSCSVQDRFFFLFESIKAIFTF